MSEIRTILTRDAIEEADEVARTFVEHKRWSVEFDVVIKTDDGSHYRYRDSVPATECQERDDWDDDVTVHPVVAQLEQVVQWVDAPPR